MGKKKWGQGRGKSERKVSDEAEEQAEAEMAWMAERYAERVRLGLVFEEWGRGYRLGHNVKVMLPGETR